MTVAALYVERGGPYFTMPGVDPWGIDRDARTYAGPHPVVAHPPCGPWGDLAHLSKGNDKDCAPLAVEQVRTYGGVLEHPHRSKLWSVMSLPGPGYEDCFGFTIQVDQVSWGHVARKRTRLYFVGVDRSLVESTTLTGGVATHWVCGTRVRKEGKRNGGITPAGIKFCSAEQRRRTPLAFAAWLVALASSAWTFGVP